MKKFLVKIVTFVLILSAILGGVNEWYKVMPSYSNDGTKKFASMPNNIEICNFGSSHGEAAYNYDNYADTYNCFNFALAAQTLSYDYNLLDYYQNCLSEDCTVFITLSYFSFIGVDETQTQSFASKNKRYYGILDKDHIKEYSSEYAILLNYLPCLCVEPNILIYTLLGKGADTDTTNYQTAGSIDLASNVQETVEYHLTERVDVGGNYIVNQSEIDSLYQLLNLCKKNHYKPILVTTPYLSEYTTCCENLASDGLALFYATVDNIVAETGIKYLDYSHDERFSNRYDLFFNGDHLNPAGSLVFTDILMQDVIEQPK